MSYGNIHKLIAEEFSRLNSKLAFMTSEYVTNVRKEIIESEEKFHSIVTQIEQEEIAKKMAALTINDDHSNNDKITPRLPVSEPVSESGSGSGSGTRSEPGSKSETLSDFELAKKLHEEELEKNRQFRCMQSYRATQQKMIQERIEQEQKDKERLELAFFPSRMTRARRLSPDHNSVRHNSRNRRILNDSSYGNIVNDDDYEHFIIRE